MIEQSRDLPATHGRGGAPKLFILFTDPLNDRAANHSILNPATQQFFFNTCQLGTAIRPMR